MLATNVGAIGLWRKLGFEEVGRLPEAFEHPEAGFVDALVMFKGLKESTSKVENPTGDCQYTRGLAARANELLSGLTVKKVLRLEENEIVIEFEESRRLFVDSKAEIDVSIT